MPRDIGPRMIRWKTFRPLLLRSPTLLLLASSGRTAAPRAGLTVEESVHVDEIDAGERTERALRGGQRGHHLGALGRPRPRHPFPTPSQFGVGPDVGCTG